VGAPRSTEAETEAEPEAETEPEAEPGSEHPTAMAAYNLIVVRAPCPSCKRPSEIRCQTHVASSFDGDERGRFCARTYTLGETMAWWGPGDPRFEQWCDGALPTTPPLYEEACYSTCASCQADLCVVIEFRNVVPTRVVGVTTEQNWPAGHLR